MRENRHCTIKKQAADINQVLRGHYAYYGVAGNIGSLKRFYRIVDRYWRKVLISRSQKSYITWERYPYLKGIFPLQQPKIYLSYADISARAVL